MSAVALEGRLGFDPRLLACQSGRAGQQIPMQGRIPDLEYDAVRYLGSDYVVDNTALEATGYKFIYPDFEESMKQMGEWYKKEGRSCR